VEDTADGAGSRAVAAVVVGLMVFSSSAGPEPEQSGSGETASASNGPVYPESSPHPFAGDSTWIAYQTDRGDRRVSGSCILTAPRRSPWM
jgi:hypothetical protein